MKIIFIGTGEAFNENQANISILIDGKTKLLLDCGINNFSKLFKFIPDINFLDAVYISHFHADHAFGIISLLMRSWEDKRVKPLTIIGQTGIENYCKQIMGLAYSEKMYEKIINQFPINYIEVDEGHEIDFNEYKLKFTKTTHGKRNLAILVSDGQKSICYTGDTKFSEDVIKLAKGCDLLIHESYISKEAAHKEHCSHHDAASVAKLAGARKLALVHVRRSEKLENALAEAKSVFENTFIPNDGDVLEI